MKNNNNNGSFVPATTYENLIENKQKIMQENQKNQGGYTYLKIKMVSSI
jgi:hypothetical protein